jgi:hypothetical protein
VKGVGDWLIAAFIKVDVTAIAGLGWGSIAPYKISGPPATPSVVVTVINGFPTTATSLTKYDQEDKRRRHVCHCTAYILYNRRRRIHRCCRGLSEDSPGEPEIQRSNSLKYPIQLVLIARNDSLDSERTQMCLSTMPSTSKSILAASTELILLKCGVYHSPPRLFALIMQPRQPSPDGLVQALPCLLSLIQR